jgi:hypothetical protein
MTLTAHPPQTISAHEIKQQNNITTGSAQLMLEKKWPKVYSRAYCRSPGQTNTQEQEEY